MACIHDFARQRYRVINLVCRRKEEHNAKIQVRRSSYSQRSELQALIENRRICRVDGGQTIVSDAYGGKTGGWKQRRHRNGLCGCRWATVLIAPPHLMARNVRKCSGDSTFPPPTHRGIEPFKPTISARLLSASRGLTFPFRLTYFCPLFIRVKDGTQIQTNLLTLT